jgi:DNA polymerase-3 subunit epsilon
MSKEKLYAIVDLETTGGRAARDKITEIAIVLHDGRQIIDKYETLVNPECYIPYGITELTGITQEMVADAPKFYEVARKVVKMTEGAVFVAHNVRFDYSFLREEFARLGYTFTRKQLCTVRLSRQAFPGFRSYSLGNLIQNLGIKVDQRHRAMSDALATVEILEKVLAKESGEESLNDMVNLGIKESLLPANLTMEKIHALPEECGVYYMYDENGQVVYVGKSINIKKRIAEHFADKTEKARKMQERMHDLSYELTGSELVALLLESAEIKRLQPSLNRAQRIQRFPFAIHTFLDDAGYRRFEILKVSTRQRKRLQIISEYPKLGAAKGRLLAAREEYDLCNRLLHLDPGSGPCFHYHLKQCRGACAGQEAPEFYNERADEALERLSTVFEQDFFVLDQGRTPDEQAVVMVRNGQYGGFGYLDRSESIRRPADLADYVRPMEGNPETTRIIQRFLSKAGAGVRVLRVD